MRLKEWGEVIFEDFPAIRVAEEAIEGIVESARKYLTRDVKLAMGRVYADREYEARRLKILSRPLP